MTDLDKITKEEAVSLLRRGMVTPLEAAVMAVRDRQITRVWAGDFRKARQSYLTRLHRSVVRSRNLTRAENKKSPPEENSSGKPINSRNLDMGADKKDPRRKNVTEVI